MYFEALRLLFEPQSLLALAIGVFGGITVGALPGLSASMAVALLIPVSFSMTTEAGLILLVSVYTSAIYGGSITACLLHTPGTPSSAATAMDGYALTRQGKGMKALGLATVGSMIGGTFSAIALLLIAPTLASISLRFNSSEYFLIMVFGLTIIGSLGGENMIKGLLSGCIGLLFSCVGLDLMNGMPRFTFGSINMERGIQLVPALIGLFSISQVMISIEEMARGSKTIIDSSIGTLHGQMLPTRAEMKRLVPTIIKSCLIGTGVGILPGAGGDIGSWVAYNSARKSSKHPEEFGNGSIEGVMASEVANNAVCGGALIPMITLGIPGSGTVAILMGGMMIKGLTPGYRLFTERGGTTYSIILGFLLTNILMGLVGFMIAKKVAHVSRVPMAILCPLIIALSAVGAFAVYKNIFDVYAIAFFGLLGYLMRKYGFATAPVVLGLILGVGAEQNFRQLLVLSRGNLLGYCAGRPISVVLAIMIVAALFSPVYMAIMNRKARPSTTGSERPEQED